MHSVRYRISFHGRKTLSRTQRVHVSLDTQMYPHDHESRSSPLLYASMLSLPVLLSVHLRPLLPSAESL